MEIENGKEKDGEQRFCSIHRIWDFCHLYMELKVGDRVRIGGVVYRQGEHQSRNFGRNATIIKVEVARVTVIVDQTDEEVSYSSTCLALLEQDCLPFQL